MFTDAFFYNSLLVTLMFLIMSAWIGQLCIGLGAAAILRKRNLRMRWLPTAAIMMTMAVPETAAAFMWASMLVPNETGIANIITGFFGADPISWTKEFPILSIALINIWKGMGMAFILLAAGFEAIGEDVREAATVDGATGLKLFLYITLPILAPTILLFLLLTTVGSIARSDSSVPHRRRACPRHRSDLRLHIQGVVCPSPAWLRGGRRSGDAAADDDSGRLLSQTATGGTMKRPRRRVRTPRSELIFNYGFAAFLVVYSLVPFFWLMVSAFDTKPQLWLTPLEFTFQNFVNFFAVEKGLLWTANSLIYAVGTVSLVLLASALGGYSCRG